jgi:hypothetical protein
MASGEGRLVVSVYRALARRGWLASDWDDWRQLRGLAKEREAWAVGEFIPAMLDPDDPGIKGENPGPLQWREPCPSIKMHIGPWCIDSQGCRWREVMSIETYARRDLCPFGASDP